MSSAAAFGPKLVDLFPELAHRPAVWVSARRLRKILAKASDKGVAACRRNEK
jgi:hypothetical protein